jgi:hypothetical protein
MKIKSKLFAVLLVAASCNGPVVQKPLTNDIAISDTTLGYQHNDTLIRLQHMARWCDSIQLNCIDTLAKMASLKQWADSVKANATYD